MWIAVSIYVLVAIVKKQLNLDLSLYTILQILSLTLFERRPILQVLSETQPRRRRKPFALAAEMLVISYKRWQELESLPEPEYLSSDSD